MRRKDGEANHPLFFCAAGSFAMKSCDILGDFKLLPLSGGRLSYIKASPLVNLQRPRQPYHMEAPL